MKKKPWLLIILFGLLLGGLLIISTYVNADFIYTPTLLSNPNAECYAVEPRAASSNDKQWLSVVWIQVQKKADGACDPLGSGRAVLSAATEGTARAGWSDRLVVFDGSPTSSCVIHSDIAMAGPIAHVVASVREPCSVSDPEDSQYSKILYRTCDTSVTPITCSETEVATGRSHPAQYKRITDVRITLDSNNQPHIVYGVANFYNQLGAMFYHRKTSGSWGTEAPQRLSGDISNTEPAYRPQIDWSSVTVNSVQEGRLHFVWETHTELEGATRLEGRVVYRNCPETGACDTSSLLLGNGDGVGFNYERESTHPIPNVAAQGDDVVVIWSKCRDIDADNSPCQKFMLAYRRSESGGLSESGSPFLEGREPISDNTLANLGNIGSPIGYPGTDDRTAEHRTSARPSIDLDANGYPYIVWQTAEDPDLSYTDYYTIATGYVTGTTGTEGLGWANPGWHVGNGYDIHILSDVLIPDLDAGKHGFHLFYMKWDNVAVPARYRIYYDYVGDNRIDPTPTPTPRCGVGEDDPCLIFMARIKRASR